MKLLQLKRDDCDFFVAAMEAAINRSNPPKPNVYYKYFGYTDFFNVADALGLNRKWATTRAKKFEKWGWWESRNNYDAWVLAKGVEAYEQLTSKKYCN